jgi:predicted XRE-type DNA-binding protein
MVIARMCIENSGMSQKCVAKKSNCSQPRISSLMNGEIDKFSCDWLLNFIESMEGKCLHVSIAAPKTRL